MSTSPNKVKPKDIQYFLIIRAWMSVSETRESNMEQLGQKMLKTFKDLVSADSDLTEAMKDSVLKGNGNVYLTGYKLWSRAKDYSKEIRNTVLPIYKEAVPSGMSSPAESFELLRKKLWLKKESEKKRKSKKTQGLEISLSLSDCPDTFHPPVFYTFVRLHAEGRLLKFSEEPTKGATGSMRKNTVSRQTQRAIQRSELKKKREEKAAQGDQVKVAAYRSVSRKKIKIAKAKAEVEIMAFRLDLAREAAKSNIDTGKELLETLARKELAKIEKENGIDIITLSDSDDDEVVVVGKKTTANPIVNYKDAEADDFDEDKEDSDED